MIPLIFYALILSVSGGVVEVVEPQYPPNVIQGGTVVATLAVSEGTVLEVKTLLGEEPFVESTIHALEKWRFPNELDEDSLLVVVNFRNPNFYATDSASQKLSPAKAANPAVPIPSLIVEPSYPPNSIGEGATVLLLHVSEKGSVEKVEEVKGAGLLTSAAIKAVEQWQFEAAENADGEKISSIAYAVCIFRRPVLGGR